MKPKQWLLSAFLVPLVVVAQQPQRFLPGRLVQPPPAVNREQPTSREGTGTLPSPPPFVTSPSFSFDNPGPTAESPRATRPTVSTAAFRPRARPVIRPVSDVQLQNFRPNSRFLRLPIRPRGRQTTSRPVFPTQPPPALRRPAANTRPQAAPRTTAPQTPPAAPVTRPRPPPPVQVQPAAVPPPPQFPTRRLPSPPLAPPLRTQPVAPFRSPPTTIARQPPQSPSTPPIRRLQPPPSTVAVQPPPLVRTRPAQPLPPPTVPFAPPLPSRRPIPPTVGLNTPTGLRVAPRPRTPPGAHPPSVSPPDNATIQELNSAQDFMQVANRLSLQRRFARHRHRNRRHADFIERQQKKQQ